MGVLYTKDDFIVTARLPQFSNIYELADIIRVSPRLLFCLSMRTSHYYRTFSIPKKNGGTRTISSPSYCLRIIQKWILECILKKVYPSECAMAFRGREFGCKNNALFHSKSMYGLHMDFESFFASIDEKKVFLLFQCLGYNDFASTILKNLCMLDGGLPQGGICSSALSNLVCKPLDQSIKYLCDAWGIRYTRYADDLFLSCDNAQELALLYPVVIKRARSMGFNENKKKTKYLSARGRFCINGITIHREWTPTKETIELKAKRDMKRLLRSEIHRMVITGNYSFMPEILGKISYINYIERSKDKQSRYLVSLKCYIKNLAEKILLFPELVHAYNEHPFTKDQLRIEPDRRTPATDDEAEMMLHKYEDAVELRKKYLQRVKIDDICQYCDYSESDTLDGSSSEPF